MLGRRITTIDLRHGRVPLDLTGVRWSNGAIECRHRVTHHDGPMCAEDDDTGDVLTAPGEICDHCTAACD